MSEFRHVVTAEENGLPLKTIVKQNFSFSSRLITKLRQQELIKVNDIPTPGWVGLNAGDVVTVNLPEERSDYPPEDIPIEVCYEDEDLLVINKQPGFVVHPTKGKPYHTIANGIMLKMLLEGKLYKIRFVNRLDMNTSGLLIVAKNSHSQDNLEKQMKADVTEKRYKALVEGIVKEDEGTIDRPIGRPDPEEVERWILPVERGGFESVTHFRVLERFELPHVVGDTEKGETRDGYSLVELRLETGRTHQIRVHMASIGHPVVGDHLYCYGDPFEYRRIHGDPRPPKDGTKGPRETNPEVVSDLIDRQALHAFSLDFFHPVTGEKLHIEADLPEDMKRAVEELRRK